MITKFETNTDCGRSIFDLKNIYCLANNIVVGGGGLYSGRYDFHLSLSLSFSSFSSFHILVPGQVTSYTYINMKLNTNRMIIGPNVSLDIFIFDSISCELFSILLTYGLYLSIEIFIHQLIYYNASVSLLLFNFLFEIKIISLIKIIFVLSHIELWYLFWRAVGQFLQTLVFLKEILHISQ